MNDVKWIKVAVGLFEDEKIIAIESMKNGYAFICVWMKLLCLAGKQCNSGVLAITDGVPFTTQVLSAAFRMPEKTIYEALKVFKTLGMIETVNGFITIPNWEKHQQMDQLEKNRNATKERMQRYRSKQKLIADNAGDVTCDVTCDVTVTDNVTPCYGDRIRNKNKNKRIDIEEEEKEEEGALHVTATAADSLEAYAANWITKLTPANAQELISYRDSLPDDVIKHAIDRANAKGVSTYAYVKAILNGYVTDGVRSMGDAVASDVRFDSNKSKPAAKTGQDRFNYQQHSVTEADFGPDFYYDPAKELQRN